MTTESTIRIFAGAVALASLALGVQASPAFHSANWLWLSAFVGANLFQSGFTGFCPNGAACAGVGGGRRMRRSRLRLRTDKGEAANRGDYRAILKRSAWVYPATTACSSEGSTGLRTRSFTRAASSS